MSFEIRRLSDTLGAEVIGLDLSMPLDDTTFAKVHQAHLDHLVLVFRGQRLTPQQQIEFSKRFGPLDQHPATHAVLSGYPEILVVSTKRENGEYVGIPNAGPKWHSDLAYKERTALGSMLYALELPDAGGDTGFANMYKAYDALPSHLKHAVEGKRAVFQASPNNRKGLSPVLHPIIRTHPETGRKLVFANAQHTTSIEGMNEAESADILSELFTHNAQPDFVYHHKWREGDLTFWDNRCVQHIADHTRLDDPAYIRHMHRTTIGGDVPF